MKVLSKILGILILLGLVMAVAAFFMGLDIAGLRGFFNDDEAYGEMLTETISDDINTIEIDVETRSIVVHVVESSDISVTYYAHVSRDTWTFEVVGSTYAVKQKEKVGFFNFLNYKFVSEDIKTVHLYIPNDVTYTMNLETSVGAVRVEFDEVITIKDLTVTSNTGSVYVKNVFVESLHATTDTGYVMIKDVESLGVIIVDSDTGSLSLTDIIAESFELDSDTGSITLTRTEASTLIASVETGRITVIDSSFLGDVDIHTSTGDININDTIASSFDLSSSTGDVGFTSTTFGDYRYDLRTSTGTIRVDGSNQGDRHSTTTGTVLIKVEVSTGNITINTIN